MCFQRKLLPVAVLIAVGPGGTARSALPAPPSPPGVEEATERIHELRRQHRYEEALRELDRACERFPDDPPLHGLYAWIYLDDLNDADSALAWARQLQQRFPDHDVGFVWEASTHRKEGRWQDCIDALRRSPAFERYHEHSVRYATCLYHADRWPEALAALPGPEQYGTGFERFAGWPVWLEGRIARRQILEERMPQLEAELGCTTPGCRARLLAKLAILGVPQGAELAERAAEGGSSELVAAASGLRQALLVPPDFRSERHHPEPIGGTTVPVTTAVAQLFELVDSLPSGGSIPPIEGHYLQQEMIEMAKRFPSAAQPLRLEVDEERHRYSLGAGWNRADGSVDLSFEPGRWYSISAVRSGALVLLSVGMQEEGTTITLMSYDPTEGGLELRTRTWSELGEAMHLAEHTSRLVRVEN